MSFVKKFLKNIIYGEKASSEKYVKFLRNKGVSIGKNVRFYAPAHTVIDVQTPFILSIGNNVCITHGVVILTHDYAWSVIKRKTGCVLGAQSPVVIGNNVFIGMNAVITRGVTVGDNVIIGAGSVVTKDCEADSVYAGNPAKRIMSLEDYTKKREAVQFEEAKALALAYRDRFGEDPPKEVFREYFMLFSSAEAVESCREYKNQLECCGNYDESIVYMRGRTPIFDSFEDFLRTCYK